MSYMFGLLLVERLVSFPHPSSSSSSEEEEEEEQEARSHLYESMLCK